MNDYAFFEYQAKLTNVGHAEDRGEPVHCMIRMKNVASLHDIELRQQAGDYVLFVLNPGMCCFVIESFLARSSAATKWRRAVFVAPLLSASALLFFGPRMSHAFPFIALCMGFTPTDPLDRLCGWLVFDGDRIKEHRVWTRLIVPCLDALG
jgi:hypothetical protein